ncbi:exopolyphosphatase/guanosine-5'-triphosphate,3'-diphosphate pyrophosphatase [Roseibium hamelinense]|uniref:Exopolyphosphatase/guanosine-5'-triphosphate, 3'-diphosphate pyrophosphatase n=1 Tax=Roseibium hamelinense TaxID=150831 RepID=A0A562TIS8_9HYPH|nr:Ppx/GppA phosphatase family protein [Roseibium hamelinense]MTI45606.1 Ppx/GppA family phosphatase [Roseibium hamelinense]TWI93214.1 exopolyphosphatase/guanosine-5'-triphosphate,3'-diphosphate pyrophosphatase [Roseibium hamelinense]
MTSHFEPARGRLNGTGPIAVIDIGSNSVRLVVYERVARTPTMLFNEKVLAGLGRGIAATGRLSDSSVDIALQALVRFRALIDHVKVETIHVIATAAARDADNGAEFVQRVEEVVGAPVRILDGSEEAHYSALGVIAGFWRPRGIVGDMGGGSLELVEIAGKTAKKGRTFPLGGLRLQEQSGGKIAKAQKIADEELSGFTWPVMARGERTFYAVGGTWRSLGRLHLEQQEYPLHVMHNYEVPADEAIAFCRSIAVPNLEGLAGSDRISKQRRPLVPFGAVVLERVLQSMNADRVVFSATGVREGLLHEHLAPEMQAADPVIEAARELAELRARSPRHAEELIGWTDELFEHLEMEETENERRLRHAACLLSDIGWRAHPDYRGEQSLNIISNAAFVGLDHAGRAYLAAAVFYRHQGLGEGKLSPVIRQLFTDRLRYRAKVLGAALRVASLLSASMEGILPQVQIRSTKDGIELELPENLAAFDGERLRRRFDQLAKTIGSSADIRIAQDA